MKKKNIYIALTILTCLILSGMACDDGSPTATVSQNNDQTAEKARFLLVCDGYSYPSGNVSGNTAGMTFSARSTPSGVSYSARQISAAPNGKLFFRSPIQEKGAPVRMEPQCGTYEITVNQYGEPIFYTDSFKYSGEKLILITQGFGWRLYITTEPWGVVE